MNARVRRVLSDGLVVSFLMYFQGTVDAFHLREVELIQPGFHLNHLCISKDHVLGFMSAAARMYGPWPLGLLIHFQSLPKCLTDGDAWKHAYISMSTNAGGQQGMHVLLHVCLSPLIFRRPLMT